MIAYGDDNLQNKLSGGVMTPPYDMDVQQYDKLKFDTPPVQKTPDGFSVRCSVYLVSMDSTFMTSF